MIKDKLTKSRGDVDILQFKIELKSLSLKTNGVVTCVVWVRGVRGVRGSPSGLEDLRTSAFVAGLFPLLKATLQKKKVAAGLGAFKKRDLKMLQ